MIRKSFFLFAFFLTLTLSLSAYAINGPFDYGFSIINRGMGGTGSALPQDSIIAALNPAGMVLVGDRFDAGGELIISNMYYNATVGTVATGMNVVPKGQIAMSPGIHNNRLYYALPELGFNWMINSRNSIGFTSYSLSGFGSFYGTQDGLGPTTIRAPGIPLTITGAGPFGDGVLASDLKEGAFSLTFAHKFWRSSAIGVSFITAVQTFMSKGAAGLAAFSNFPNELSNKGHDYSVGIGTRIGVLLGIAPSLRIAASYQPKIRMSKFNLYKGLFPNGKLDTPANGVLGLVFQPTQNLIFAFDIQKVWTRGVKAYSNLDTAILPGGACNPSVQSDQCFGGDNGPGFGWRNSTSFKAGVQWAYRPDILLRAGYNYSTSVVRGAMVYLNILAPAVVIRNIYTLGATKMVGKHNQFNFLLSWVPPQSKSGVNPLSANGQVVTLHASGVVIGFSWSYKFA